MTPKKKKSKSTRNIEYSQGIFFAVSPTLKKRWLRYAYGEILAGRARTPADAFRNVISSLGKRAHAKPKKVKKADVQPTG